jgi:endonuclease/exonuclease/phosphatase (EEP) superfamily protein YafD
MTRGPRLAAGIVVAALAASLLALAAERWWLADLAVNFRAQYAVVGALGALSFAALRRPVVALAALAVVALNLPPLLATLRDAAPAAAMSAATTAASAASAAAAPTAPLAPLRLVSANVLYLSADYARVLGWVRRDPADVLVVVEATAAWRDALAPLRAIYPYSVASGVTQRRGVLVLSRWPLTPPEPLFDGSTRAVGLATTVDVGGSALRLIAVHASWPTGPAAARERAANLARVARFAAAAAGEAADPRPVVVAGDLNVSPFSPHFARLLRDGRLRSAAQGYWLPTWPIQLLPAGIQIDHVLVSAAIGVRAIRRGPAIGSDHLPVVADLAVPGGRASGAASGPPISRRLERRDDLGREALALRVEARAHGVGRRVAIDELADRSALLRQHRLEHDQPVLQRPQLAREQQRELRGAVAAHRAVVRRQVEAHAGFLP